MLTQLNFLSLMNKFCPLDLMMFECFHVVLPKVTYMTMPERACQVMLNLLANKKKYKTFLLDFLVREKKKLIYYI